MLPASLNRTYVDGTPVHPGDLNDIQDSIIALHAASLLSGKTFELAGCDWQSITGDNALDTEGLWTCDDLSFELVAPLLLPVGSRIDQCVFSTRRTSPVGNTYTERLMRRAPGAANAEIVIDSAPSLSTVAWVAHDIINTASGGVGAGPGPHLIAAGYRYWLSLHRFSVDVLVSKFDGVQLAVSWP